MQFATSAKPENRPKFKDRTKNPPKVMFKKAALILTAIASLTIANTYAIPAAFQDFYGHPITQINQTLTILSADQNSVHASWKNAYNPKAVAEGTINLAAAFYLTNKTSFSGGNRSDAVKVAKFTSPTISRVTAPLPIR